MVGRGFGKNTESQSTGKIKAYLAFCQYFKGDRKKRVVPFRVRTQLNPKGAGLEGTVLGAGILGSKSTVLIRGIYSAYLFCLASGASAFPWVLHLLAC